MKKSILSYNMKTSTSQSTNYLPIPMSGRECQRRELTVVKHLNG